MPPDTAKERVEDRRGLTAEEETEWSRKKLGGRMLEFVNSQLQEDKARHRTVVFVPPPCSLDRYVQTECQYNSTSTQTSSDDEQKGSNEQITQTEFPEDCDKELYSKCDCCCQVPDTGQLPTVDTGQLTCQQQSPPRQAVCLETLYGVLMEEHAGLAWQMHRYAKRANEAESCLERTMHESEQSKTNLEARLAELSEENDLLEFRLLEMEQSTNHKSTNVLVQDGTRWDHPEPDDISDSGVMSLPTSEDDISMCDSEGSEVMKWRLLGTSRLSRANSPSTPERTCLQETLTILGQHENKLQPTMRYGEGKIVATVQPFSSVDRRLGDSDVLEESGIFEESTSTSSRYTQTDPPLSQGDLTQEIRKLAQIRERIEESKVPSAETRELVYCRERLSTLENRLSQYEALPQHRDTRERLEAEARFRSQIDRLEERVQCLKQENIKLEEQCSEFEEAENDTRLRCQKLEMKVSSLGEKKSSLKAQVELNERVITDLKNSLADEEMKTTDARQQVSRLEATVHQYEKKNFELEEREMEVRYRLQALESTLPGLMMWNMWRMMMVMQLGMADSREKESEMLMKLKSLETRLYDEQLLLEESRKKEQELKNKIDTLETLLGTSEEEGLATADKLKRLTAERDEKEKRIRDLELREKLYRETLQQADSMFADMESDYKRQIKDREKELREKELELAELESKMRRLTKDRDNSVALHERAHSLETELRSMRQSLNKREQDKVSLKLEEERLKSELHTFMEENQILKCTEDSVRSDLDFERRTVKELNQLISRLEAENNSIQQDHETEVGKYRKQMKKLGMELMESEVTISEFKEEVQTLELAIEELREELRAERERTEGVRMSLETELEVRTKKLEQLEKTLSGTVRADNGLRSGAKGAVLCSGLSLREELEQAEEKPVPAARADTLIRTPVPHPRKIKDGPQM